MDFFYQCNLCCHAAMSQFPQGANRKYATVCAACHRITGWPTLEQIEEAEKKYLNRKKVDQCHLSHY